MEHGRIACQISLGALALHDLRDLWKGVYTIIIDEVSMVSYQILKLIHSQLCEIYANDDIFGGLNVIAVGDFYQLFPVNGSFIFSDQQSSGRLASYLWRDFFTMVELKVNMRQQILPSQKCSIAYVRESTPTRTLKQFRDVWYQMET